MAKPVDVVLFCETLRRERIEEVRSILKSPPPVNMTAFYEDELQDLGTAIACESLFESVSFLLKSRTINPHFEQDLRAQGSLGTLKELREDYAVAVSELVDGLLPMRALGVESFDVLLGLLFHGIEFEKKMIRNAKRHGLSREMAMDMLREQNGHCPICRRKLDLDFAFDHDHDHCKSRGCAICVRGIAHSKCNVAIGMIGDDAHAGFTIGEYLHRSKVALDRRNKASDRWN